ncbi:MAG TPA: hypothetical protein VLG25_00545 [Patescibacteria group bacterium]|nr:hypothetical protein [Patescibacteria group bacterium]
MDDHETSLMEPMPEVPGPNPFPTGSRVETSAEIYAAGAPPIEANSRIVQEVMRLRAAKFNIVPSRPAPMNHEPSPRLQKALETIMPKIEKLKSPGTQEHLPDSND